MNNMPADELPSGSGDSRQNSCKKVCYSSEADQSQASGNTSNCDRPLNDLSESTNTSSKRKFSSIEASTSTNESPRLSHRTKLARKFVNVDMNDYDVTETNSNESSNVDMADVEVDTNEERVEGAFEAERPRTASSVMSYNGGRNSDTETFDFEESSDDIVGDRLRSYCSSQASPEEASFTSSDSSVSSQSSESDIFLARDNRSRYEFSDEDNNNNRSSNDVVFTGDSDDDTDSNSNDQEDDESERIPQVLKKTLPNQRFSFPREIMNRQFYDNFKRKRALEFENVIYGSRKMVQRLKLYKTLEQHSGSVNSISFNETGEVLISASDDRHACLWDWTNKKCLLYFDTGHVANVFQAKFLPCSGDTHMVTCGADSQVRLCLLDQCGLKSTSLIVKHARTVHNIALQKQVPNTFLTAGEDGVVYSIDIRESNHFPHKLLKVVNSRARHNLPVVLYGIDCNPMKNHEFIVCGNDKDVRLFDLRKISPDNTDPVKTFCSQALSASQDSRNRPQQLKKYLKSVTCAVYNYNGTEILASYNDNDIYLFDSCTSEEVHHYDGHRNFASIKGVNFYGPHSEYIVSGSDCGYVYLWDKNSEAIVQWMKGDHHIVNCLEPHPSFPVLATSGVDSDVKIWMPVGDGEKNVRELPEFQKVTRKNYFYKYTSAFGYSRRWAVLRSSFFADDIAVSLYHLI